MLPDLTAAHARALAHHLPRAVAWLREAPALLALALLFTGALLLVAGARARRPVALAGGVLAGALAGAAFGGALGVAPDLAVLAAAALGGLAALALPAVFPVALGATLGALAGARLPLAGPAIGAALGALLLAGLALLAARPLAAALAGLGGALLVVAGSLSLGLPGTGPLLRHPVAALAVVLVAGIAGAAAQLETAWGGGEPASRRGGRGRLAPPRAPRDDGE